MKNRIFLMGLAVAALSSSIAYADNDYKLSNDLSYLSGNIESRHHIYYTGDTMDIRVTINENAELLTSQAIDLYIGVFDLDGNLSYSQVSNQAGASSTQLFYSENLSSALLAPGNYHLALIATKPGGDPGNVADWYNGFAGILDRDALYYTESNASGDFDRDGEWDDDYDRDGYQGDDDIAHEYYFNKEGKTMRSSQDREWDDDDWNDDTDDDYNDDDGNESDSSDDD